MLSRRSGCAENSMQNTMLADADRVGLLRPPSPTPRMTTAKTAESPPSGPC